MSTATRTAEKGAVLVHVAIAIVGLLAFTAFAVDYGILWVARRQVQNSADAGALAGAISLAYGVPPANKNDLNDPQYLAAKAAAAAVARQNGVWGVSPRVVEGTDVTIINCPDGAMPDKCVRVNAYRNQEGGDGNAALPTFFARMVGVNQQGVRATATAEIMSGNIIPHCIKPFAIADRWMDGPPYPATPSVLGDTYNPPPLAQDYYDPTQTRWKFPDDYGTPVVLHSDSHARPTSNWAQLTDIAGHGTADLREAIVGCVDVSIEINPTFPEAVDLKNGGSEGLKHGVDDLVDMYPNTVWVHAPAAGQPNGHLVCGDPGGCEGNNRIGAVPVYSPNDVTQPMTSMPVLDVIGIYIEGMGDDPAVEAAHPEFVALVPKKSERKKYVIGHMVPVAGLRSGTAGTPRDSSFMRTVVLVR